MRWQLALTCLVISTGAASAQTRITAVPSPVQQGQPVTITGMPCAAGKAEVLFQGTPVPATPGQSENSFQVATASLAPNTYKVTMRCGTATSTEFLVDIVAAATAVAASAPSVICAENLSPRDGAPRPEGGCDQRFPWTVRLEDVLAVHVAGYSTWIANPDNKQATLHMFLEGIELANLQLRYLGKDPVTNADVLWALVKFESDDAATENRELWAQVLRMARRKDRLTVSVGPTGGPQWGTTATIRLNSYPTALSVFAATVIVFLIAVLVWAGKSTPLLRDNNGAIRPPYSLAKHQMAVWFVVVVSAFLFVTMTTGAAAAASSTALILIGISGATGLAAVVIDGNKRGATVSDRQTLESERDALTQLLDDPSTGLKAQLGRAAPGSTESTQIAATIQAKLERLSAVTILLSKAPSIPDESQEWLEDLLSDHNGTSFHRLQIAVWTIVLVGAFVMAVWRTFAMPDFDATTLGLMGISSGTYLGFKFPEQQS